MKQLYDYSKVLLTFYQSIYLQVTNVPTLRQKKAPV